MWRVKWSDIITLFDFPPPIRKVIYTTNAIESVNSVIRKFTRNRKIDLVQSKYSAELYLESYTRLAVCAILAFQPVDFASVAGDADNFSQLSLRRFHEVHPAALAAGFRTRFSLGE